MSYILFPLVTKNASNPKPNEMNADSKRAAPRLFNRPQIDPRQFEPYDGDIKRFCVGMVVVIVCGLGAHPIYAAVIQVFN